MRAGHCRPHQRKGASGRVSGKAPSTGPRGSGLGGRRSLQRLCLCVSLARSCRSSHGTPGPLTVTQRGLHGHLLLVSYFLETSYFSTTWSPRQVVRINPHGRSQFQPLRWGLLNASDHLKANWKAPQKMETDFWLNVTDELCCTWRKVSTSAQCSRFLQATG